MLPRGFVQPSSSPAASQMLFVGKKDTTNLRLCVDYREVNKLTLKNRYLVPSIDLLLDRIRGARFFTRIDLRETFHLIRIRQGDEWKTAFRTPFGLYEFNVMPFGLCNAPATFQAYIDHAMQGLENELVVYLDDILIHAETLDELRTRTRHCLDRLRQHRLFAKLKKCEFEVQQTHMLGFVVDHRGISMEPERISAIMDWPAPRPLTKSKNLWVSSISTGGS